MTANKKRKKMPKTTWKKGKKLGQKEAKKEHKLGHTRDVQKRKKGVIKRVKWGSDEEKIRKGKPKQGGKG